MADISRLSTDTSRLQKPSGPVAWLKAAVATAGAVAGAGVIAVTLHLVTSRSDELPSIADWARASVAAAVPFSHGSATTAREMQLGQQSRRDESRTTRGAVDTARAALETSGTQSSDDDWGLARSNSEVTAPLLTAHEATDHGDFMVSLGDYTAARLLYRFAADRGSADAALKLAKTYDAAFLPQTVGLRPDAAEAARWYHEAKELQSATRAE